MTVVPDSIDPLVGYRSWGIHDGKLVSQYDGTVWEPGQPCEAACPHVEHVWQAVQGEHGMTWDDAHHHWGGHKHPGAAWVGAASASAMVSVPHAHVPPNVKLPDGWRYILEVHKHQAPDENCSCGLYAAANEGGHPHNVAYGKVNLWGKVIPGTNAHRAQYAYPAEINLVGVHPSAYEPLKAYGVPVNIVGTPDRGNMQAALWGTQNGLSGSGLQKFITANLNGSQPPPLDPSAFWDEDDFVPLLGGPEPKKQRRFWKRS